MVAIVYLRSLRLSFDLQTLCSLAANCWTNDSSLNSTLDQSTIVRCQQTLANFNRLSFIAFVNNGFNAGLREGRLKSYCKRRILPLCWHGCPSSLMHPKPFPSELNGDRLALLFIQSSSLEIVFWGITIFSSQ